MGRRPTEMALAGSAQVVGEARFYELLDQILINVKDRDHSGFICSLKAINAAQKMSVSQVKEESSGNLRIDYQRLTKKEKEKIFNITVMKGAAAVLPNAYMIK